LEVEGHAAEHGRRLIKWQCAIELVCDIVEVIEKGFMAIGEMVCHVEILP
jgi:hypothetical protein